MPPKDHYGKTAQNYSVAFIAKSNAVPDYRRHPRAQRSLLLFMCLLVIFSLFWLNVAWGQRWLSSMPVAQPALDVARLKPRQTIISNSVALLCRYRLQLKDNL
ncbi:hypothetical protein [Pseudomonas oryzihabitans]|uniref:hypothetical protein n=1 Tax=Pseudomonas oryzihabitans TaxID=47885 RepID=UPI0015E41B9E|nr:hypothetical protein [Pseudomonas psychrotolerans]MBA1259251.1 hypothetical protein [Pseudomonas psychrotolerans]